MADAASTPREHVADATSAASWGAIIAGAAVALAVTGLLVLLGVGFGLAAISPWPGASTGATTAGAAAVIWLIVTQWIAAFLGGYITGRLRTKWVGAHTDEVFFRDTAHGFITWAVATVVGAAFMASGLTAVLNGGASTTLMHAGAQGRSGYFVDSLFRTNGRPNSRPDDAARQEATRIVIADTANSSRAQVDRPYLTELVASETGLAPAAASARVDAVMGDVRKTADAARRSGARLAIATAIAMLIGAFIASAAAAVGGRLRDEPHEGR
ncbi:MAG: hypothetical protein ACREHV_14665 [Rhizomicrobium sp.]